MDNSSETTKEEKTKCFRIDVDVNITIDRDLIIFKFGSTCPLYDKKSLSRVGVGKVVDFSYCSRWPLTVSVRLPQGGGFKATGRKFKNKTLFIFFLRFFSTYEVAYVL